MGEARMSEEELPTAAYSYKTVNAEGEEVWATNKLDPEKGNVQVLEKHELVRQQDVQEKRISSHDRKEAIRHILEGSPEAALTYLLLRHEHSIEDVENINHNVEIPEYVKKEEIEK